MITIAQWFPIFFQSLFPKYPNIQNNCNKILYYCKCNTTISSSSFEFTSFFTSREKNYLNFKCNQDAMQHFHLYCAKPVRDMQNNLEAIESVMQMIITLK